MSLEKAKEILRARAIEILNQRDDEYIKEYNAAVTDCIRRGMDLSSPAAQTIANIYGHEALNSEAALIKCLEEICVAFEGDITEAAIPDLQEFLSAILDRRIAKLNRSLAECWLFKPDSQFKEFRQGFDTKARRATSALPTNIELLIKKLLRAKPVLHATASAQPASSSGIFIAAGAQFDALAAVAKVVSQATTDVLIVDPYLDVIALTEFGACAPEGIQLRLLGDTATIKPGFLPAAQRWKAQYGTKRPIEVRLAATRSLHDRLIVIDRVKPWTITQSLKDLAARSPAELVLSMATADLKIAAYEAIWEQSVSQKL